jgi:tetratricopeptide (TPR) repeat protein
MASLNFVMRTLVRLVYGAALAPGTYGEALDCFCSAALLAPERLIHRVEMARAFSKLGRKEEAVQQLQRALVMDVEDINAHLQLQDAAVLLPKLERELARQQLWAPAPLQLLCGQQQQQQQGGAGGNAAA